MGLWTKNDIRHGQSEYVDGVNYVATSAIHDKTDI